LADAPPYCAFPRELCRLLQPEPARLERGLAAADERPIAYPVGTGAAEEIAFFAGFKPLIRQLLRPDELERARDRYRSLGLVVAQAEHLIPAGPSAAGRVLYVGRDEARVRAAVACEERMNHGLELGRLLGYPACCVEFYESLPLPRPNPLVHRRALARTGSRPSPRLNVLDLAMFHYLPWLPCAFDCAPSLAFANAVAMHLGKLHAQVLPANAGRRCPAGACVHQQFVARIDEALGAHRLAVMEQVQVSIEGRFDGAQVIVERAWPTIRDRRADIPVEPAAREAAARLAALVEERGSVAVTGGALVVDGERLLRADDLLLVPFGRHER
jgi:hypothetical protein